MNDDSTFCSRKAAKLAKKNNDMNLLKNLCAFARDLFGSPMNRDFRHTAQADKSVTLQPVYPE